MDRRGPNSSSCNRRSEATANRALKYEAVAQDLFTMKSCLAEGYPIVVGISVYESFESDEVAEY